MTKINKRTRARLAGMPGKTRQYSRSRGEEVVGKILGVAEADFNLEERTLAFARNCIDICRSVHKDILNQQLVGQLVRAAGSVGANYREANDAATRKEFYHRIGICRKEAKESGYWLRLLLHATPTLGGMTEICIDEAGQLTRIFASICRSRS